MNTIHESEPHNELGIVGEVEQLTAKVGEEISDLPTSTLHLLTRTFQLLVHLTQDEFARRTLKQKTLPDDLMPLE